MPSDLSPKAWNHHHSPYDPIATPGSQSKYFLSPGNPAKKGGGEPRYLSTGHPNEGMKAPALKCLSLFSFPTREAKGAPLRPVVQSTEMGVSDLMEVLSPKLDLMSSVPTPGIKCLGGSLCICISIPREQLAQSNQVNPCHQDQTLS